MRSPGAAALPGDRQPGAAVDYSARGARPGPDQARKPPPGPAPAVPAEARVDWDAAYEARALISGKWFLSVFEVLVELGECRHNQLHRAIGREVVSTRSLDATLRKMTGDGMLERTVSSDNPPTVSYRLTPLARSLLGPLSELGRWRAANRRGPLPPRRRRRWEAA